MISIVLGAVTIGLTLGLLGSGGSILTVPVLAYLVGQEEKVAIASSLAIVGIISLFAAIPHIYSKKVDWRNVFFFGVPGMFGTYLGAWAASFVTGAVQFIVFAIVMLIAAWRMLKPALITTDTPQRGHLHIILDGILVGIVTGFVGVGGGFLIVPALVLLGGLSMGVAVATSLVVISMKSLSGFIKYQQTLSDLNIIIDWKIIVMVSAVGIVGSLLGNVIAKRIAQDKLQKVFALFLVIMAGYISWQSIPQLLA